VDFIENKLTLLFTTPKRHCRCNHTRVLLYRKFCANHATSTALHMQIETPFSVHNCAGVIWTNVALDMAGLGKWQLRVPM